MEAENLEFSL